MQMTTRPSLVRSVGQLRVASGEAREGWDWAVIGVMGVVPTRKTARSAKGRAKIE